jgi:hypothetical protein
LANWVRNVYLPEHLAMARRLEPPHAVSISARARALPSHSICRGID